VFNLGPTENSELVLIPMYVLCVCVCVWTAQCGHTECIEALLMVVSTSDCIQLVGLCDEDAGRFL
jgi:hypothetical protein